MTTVYDAARVAGVSTATVSRVIRRSALANPDTRERVLAVIEALGFVPDAHAQGLSNRRKDVIGFAALDRGGTEMDIEQNSVRCRRRRRRFRPAQSSAASCGCLPTTGPTSERRTKPIPERRTTCVNMSTG